MVTSGAPFAWLARLRSPGAWMRSISTSGGVWRSLYRAVDRRGQRRLLPTEHHASEAVKAFFRKALATATRTRCGAGTCQYLNNMVAQDHRATKARTGSGSASSPVPMARTIAGIELVQRKHKEKFMLIRELSPKPKLSMHAAWNIRASVMSLDHAYHERTNSTGRSSQAARRINARASCIREVVAPEPMLKTFGSDGRQGCFLKRFNPDFWRAQCVRTDPVTGKLRFG